MFFFFLRNRFDHRLLFDWLLNDLLRLFDLLILRWAVSLAVAFLQFLLLLLRGLRKGLGLMLYLSFLHKPTNIIQPNLKLVEHGLIFHQLYLEVMICFIVVSDKVVYGFHQRPQGFAVVFFFHQKLLSAENLEEIHEAIATLFAQRLRVWR